MCDGKCRNNIGSYGEECGRSIKTSTSPSIIQEEEVRAGHAIYVDDIKDVDAYIAGAKKFDSDKIRFELLPPEALEEMAKVLTFGAKKYGDRNWEQGLSFSRVFGASMRHLWSWTRGEDLDPETGLSHLAHAGCCVMFLLTYIIRQQQQFDDRKGEN